MSADQLVFASSFLGGSFQGGIDASLAQVPAGVVTSVSEPPLAGDLLSVTCH
jgi:hypothetical protein